MKKPMVRITDYALIRYMERVCGIDCEQMRRQIGARVDAAFRAGACGVVIEGCSFRIGEDDHGPVVTTVLSGTLGQPRKLRRGRVGK